MSFSLAYTFTRTHMHTGIRTRTCTEVSVFDKARVEVLTLQPSSITSWEIPFPPVIPSLPLSPHPALKP